MDKCENVKKNHIRKCLKGQLMNFYYMNIEIIRNCGNKKKINIEKKYTSPADEFLLHPRSNMKK